MRMAGVRCVPLAWTGAGGENDYLRHNWSVSGAKIERELGFVPKTTSAAAVGAAFGNAGAAGDFEGEPDDFGLDLSDIAAYERTLFRFLHDLYWRIEVTGVEH